MQLMLLMTNRIEDKHDVKPGNCITYPSSNDAGRVFAIIDKTKFEETDLIVEVSTFFPTERFGIVYDVLGTTISGEIIDEVFETKEDAINKYPEFFI